MREWEREDVVTMKQISTMERQGLQYITSAEHDLFFNYETNSKIGWKNAIPYICCEKDLSIFFPEWRVKGYHNQQLESL